MSARRIYETSLTEVVGSPIKDVYGYWTSNFGEATFKLARIIFENDTYVHVEGEHDFPYIADYKGIMPIPEIDDEE